MGLNEIGLDWIILMNISDNEEWQKLNKNTFSLNASIQLRTILFITSVANTKTRIIIRLDMI